METARIRSLGHTVARYLLFALVGLLVLDIVFETGSLLSFLSLAGVTAALFLALALDTLLNESDTGASMRAFPEWTWLGEHRWETAIVVGFVVVGVALRLYALGEQSLWFDEAITTNAAMSVLETGRPEFPSGYTYWRAFTHTVIVAGSMVVFGTSEWAARFPSVIFGGMTIIATYWLGREVGGTRVGLLAAGLLTFATWEIAWSRQARLYQLFQLLYTLSVVALLRVDAQGLGDRRLLGGMLLAIGLAAVTHPVGYVLLPVAVVFLTTTAVLEGALNRRTAGVIVGVAVGLTVLFELIGLGITGALEQVTNTQVDYWDAYVSWFADELHAFVYLAIVGLGVMVYRRSQRAGLLFGLALGPPVFILSYNTQLFATRYLYFVLPLVFVSTAVTLVFVGETLTADGSLVEELLGDRSRSVPVGLLFVVGLIVVFVFAGGGFTTTPQAEYQLGINAPQPDFKSAYAHVNEHRQPDDVVIAGWTAPGLYYAGSVDYWLAHDLTNTGGSYTVNGTERYSGAEPVYTAGELQGVMNGSDRGWIVLDRTAELRQSGETRDVLDSRTTIAHESRRVTVYVWEEQLG